MYASQSASRIFINIRVGGQVRQLSKPCVSVNPMQHPSRSSLVFITAALLFAVPLCSADLAFNCTTPKSSTDRSKANTFVGLSGSQIAGSLLEAGTPATLWGLVPSSSIREHLHHIVLSA